MPASVRVRRRLSSSRLDVPELEPLVGKDVEIVVTEIEAPNERDPFPLRGSVVRFDDPDGPAVPPEDWEEEG